MVEKKASSLSYNAHGTMPSDKPKTQSKAQYSNKSMERALIYRELVGEFRPDLINSYRKGALGRKQPNEDDE